MKSGIALPLVAAAVVTFCPAGADAQALRCNGDLAAVGDSKASVYRKCGEPVLKDSYCKPMPLLYVGQPQTLLRDRPTVIVQPCETIDEWTYNPGSGQFMTTFRFQNGEAVAIVYGDRIP